MDIANWLMGQWTAISAAPAAYLGTIIVVWAVATLFARARLGDEAAAAKERSEHLRQRLSDVEGDKSQLLKKLESHGEDIVALKADLAARPRIFVGPEKPRDMKDGDLWIN